MQAYRRSAGRSKVKFTLEQAMKSQTGWGAIRSYVALLFNLGARWGSVADNTPWSIYHRERDPVLIAQEAGWVSGPVWLGAEDLVPIDIHFPDRPARSESLYRIRFPALE
jgi:hypothetical protein